MPKGIFLYVGLAVSIVALSRLIVFLALGRLKKEWNVTSGEPFSFTYLVQSPTKLKILLPFDARWRGGTKNSYRIRVSLQVEINGKRLASREGVLTGRPDPERLSGSTIFYHVRRYSLGSKHRLRAKYQLASLPKIPASTELRISGTFTAEKPTELDALKLALY